MSLELCPQSHFANLLVLRGIEDQGIFIGTSTVTQLSTGHQTPTANGKRFAPERLTRLLVRGVYSATTRPAEEVQHGFLRRPTRREESLRRERWMRRHRNARICDDVCTKQITLMYESCPVSESCLNRLWKGYRTALKRPALGARPLLEKAKRQWGGNVTTGRQQ